MALYNITDRIIVGQFVGAEAQAALSLTFPYILSYTAASSLIVVGFSICLSIELGGKRTRRVKELLSNSLIAGFVISLLLLLFTYIFDSFTMSLYSIDTEILSMMSRYLKIFVWGVPATISSGILLAYIQNTGSPFKAMMIKVSGIILNIILDIIFVPTYGVVAAALATLFSNIVVVVVSFVTFSQSKNSVEIQFDYRIIKVGCIKRVLSNGFAPFTSTIYNALTVLFFTKQLTVYGTSSDVASLGIINSSALFLLLPIIGLSNGMQPLISYNYGAKKYDNVKKIVMMAMTMSIAFSLLAYFISGYMTKYVVSIFINKSDIGLIEIAIGNMKLYLLAIWTSGIQIIITNFFVSIQHRKKALFLAFFRNTIFIITVVILSEKLGEYGLWISNACAEFSNTILTMILFAVFLIHGKHLNKTEPRSAEKSDV